MGLLGGSFNPAHEGHRQVAAQARRHLRLDQVWLLVSPGNPLKPQAGMAPLTQRLASARAIADGRRVVASAIETQLGTRYTLDTLRLLRRRFPRVRFVWLMGADNLLGLPRWRGWRRMARLLPFAVHPRPAYNHRALAGLAARRLRSARVAAAAAPVLATMPPPAWLFLPVAQHALSASALRAAALQPRPLSPEHPAITIRHETIAPPSAPSRKRARARPRAAPALLDQLQSLIVASLDEDKAEAIVSLDLNGRAVFADRMIIATGLADRQISAMAAHLEEKLHAAGVKRVQIEGAGGSDWVLIDAGDIIVHLFKPDARLLYGLEKMWGPDLDEPSLDEPDSGAGEAR